MPKKPVKRFKVDNKKAEKRAEISVKKAQATLDYRTLLFSIIAIIFVFTAGFYFYTVKTAAQPPTENELKACKIDGDCLEVPADCCGCENGGKSTAANRRFKGYFAENRAKECRNVACLTINVCEEGVKPRCVQGQCVLRADQPPL